MKATYSVIYSSPKNIEPHRALKDIEELSIRQRRCVSALSTRPYCRSKTLQARKDLQQLVRDTTYDDHLPGSNRMQDLLLRSRNAGPSDLQKTRYVVVAVTCDVARRINCIVHSHSIYCGNHITLHRQTYRARL